MKQAVQMVVFDWAGTTVDYGSSAPAEVFDRVFRARGITLTREEINRPMGMEKKAHIRELLSTPSGRTQWEKIYRRAWTDADVERLYESFEQALADIVAAYSTPIAGVVETVMALREQGLKIGSTTGYTGQMMELVIPRAAALGYQADCVITPDVTGASRPTPFMIFECMRRLNVYPPAAVVKVGDTVVDIEEGKNAGAWTVGILEGSNLVGLTEQAYQALTPEEQAARREQAATRYRLAGADFVISNIRELPGVIAEINRRMQEVSA